MQATQIASNGLKHEYKVVMTAADLEQRLVTELNNIKDKVKVNGFRPGRVPTAHVRKLYGRSIMADVVQNAVNEANQQIVNDNNYKLAFQPQVNLPENKDEIEAVMDAKADLSFTVALEVLPLIEAKDLSGVSLVKEVATPSDADLQEALERMAKQNTSFSPKADKAKAEDGDRLTINFVGTIDGEAFQGGSAEGIDLVIGSNTFIPGFEEQLLGAKKGDDRTVKVTFPVNYGAEHLAGKNAEFAVTVTEIATPDALQVDDELAKKFGMDTLDALKEAVKSSIQRDFDAEARLKLKKSLLDALDSLYDFPLPPSLVEQEFNGVWAGLMHEYKTEGKTLSDEGKTEDEAKAEYQKIAERRVRLGLVLADLAEKSEIKVTDEEVTKALIEKARQFPGQEKQVWDYYRKNPQAVAEIRAPIIEEKTVDLLLTQITLTEKTVSREELFADDAAQAAEGANNSDEKPKSKGKVKKKTEE
jgi:trigger factor